MSQAVLRNTLRNITETLAHEMSHASSTSPDWSTREWRLAQAVAAMHGISPLLSRTLRWRGPAEWTRFLTQQYLHTQTRHALVQQLLRRIDSGLRANHIAGTALKGAALHDIGLYRAGERPMADVDLLVQQHDVVRAASVLESLGFQESDFSFKDRTFTPINNPASAALGEHAGNALKVELHHRIAERLPLRITPLPEVLLPSGSQPGLNAYPSLAALMLHLLLHASGSMAFRSLRILQMHDIALLDARMSSADWEQLLRLLPADRSAHWAWPPLALTRRYYPLQISNGVLEALRRDCPRALRAVTQRRLVSDASFSYPKINAFPGIEWSRSLPETAAFIVRRIRPSSEQLAARMRLAQTQSWCANDRWSTASQARRVARWILTRPMRLGTRRAVQAALGSME